MDITHALLALAPNARWAISDEDYNQLEWFSDDIPVPTLDEINAKIIELNSEEELKVLREKRNQLLAETDYLALADATLTDEMRAYRQALRDLPANTADPANPVWPIKPGGTN